MLKDKKIQNYSYNIFFFVVFSFFIIFAIQPNLTTAFRLQKELQDLRLQNKQSEEMILQIVNYQSVMEEYRDNLTVLDEAVPSTPELAKVVDEISKTASASGLIVSSLTIESISFKGTAANNSIDGSEEAEVVEEVIVAQPDEAPEEVGEGTEESEDVSELTKKPDLLSFTITIDGTASLEQIAQFLNKVLGQRRLKTYDSISLSSDSSEGSTVINLLIRTYYL